MFLVRCQQLSADIILSSHSYVPRKMPSIVSRHHTRMFLVKCQQLSADITLSSHSYVPRKMPAVVSRHHTRMFLVRASNCQQTSHYHHTRMFLVRCQHSRPSACFSLQWTGSKMFIFKDLQVNGPAFYERIINGVIL